MYQTQRRFLLTGGLPPSLQARLRPQDDTVVMDGYLELAEINSGFTRVRLEIRPGRTSFAFTTRKVGRGWKRRVEHVTLPAADAERMLRWCPYRLMKRRHEIDGCTVDLYSPPLLGLVIVEKNRPGWPAFLKDVEDVVEVTDSLDNFQLAHLAHELRERPEADAIREALDLIQHLPRIVLTGGPCSGKSTVLATLRRRFDQEIHCVPEVATIVIGQLGLKPWTGGKRNLLSCQSLMYRLQHGFEEAAELQAREGGKKAVLLDRGGIDIGTYFPGGLRQLERYLFTSVPREYGRYDLVLCLESPSRQVYEAQCANNPARTETYDQARARSELNQRAWAGHPGFRLIPDGTDWPTKERAVTRAVREFLKTV
jgi:predicted ATPase